MTLFAFLLPLFSFLSGCETKTACTEMGCVGGLTIVFVTEDNEPLNDVSGMIIIDGVEHPFDCAADPNFQQQVECIDNTVFFATEEAVSVEFLVTNGNFVLGWEGTVEVNYEDSFPNGEDCPAECKTASITIPLREV